MPRSGVRPESEALLAQLRALWWAGERNQHALAAACGVTRARAQMLLRRWGVGDEPAENTFSEGINPADVIPPRREPAPGEGCAVKGGCEWPTSSGRPWWFCTQPRARGSVYCTAHHAIAFNRRAA